MMEFGQPIIRPIGVSRGKSRWKPLLLVLLPVLAILFQVYVPLFLVYLSYLEFPLLIGLHFALTRRSPVAGLLYCAAVGLAQDALSDKPLGMFGISKTLVGFLAANMSLRMDVDNPMIRFLLAFLFFVFHQVLYWVLARALLGSNLHLDLMQSLLFGLLNAVVAVPLFGVLDRLG